MYEVSGAELPIFGTVFLKPDSSKPIQRPLNSFAIPRDYD